MAKVWSEENKLARWLEVELAALDGWAEIGAVPGDAGRYFHYELTSSDVVDTGLSLQVRDAGARLSEGLDGAVRAVITRAEEHRETLIMGRTHGVHAEPTTFGLKLAG